jgi:hypothetical protein
MIVSGIRLKQKQVSARRVASLKVNDGTSMLDHFLMPWCGAGTKKNASSFLRRLICSELHPLATRLIVFGSQVAYPSNRTR